MIPILLQAHTRALTKVIYNREGDLLFSASKDPTPSVWYSHNGERLGTLKGHAGAVWTMDVAGDTSKVISGSADNTAKIWDVSTGRCLHTIAVETAVRAVDFAMGDKQLVLTTDATMGHLPTIRIYSLENLAKPVRTITYPEAKRKPTTVGWTDCNEHIVTGHEDGTLTLWDPKSGNAIKSVTNVHTDSIRDLQFSQDRSCFITASRDTTSKVVETSTLTALKAYRTERPVNSASMSPCRNEVVVAGGQEALQVTTTSSRAGQFEARFFSQVYEHEIGRVRGHFGPINTLAYHPTGLGYSSGSEDGYVRVHVFDSDYYEHKDHEYVS